MSSEGRTNSAAQQIDDVLKIISRRASYESAASAVVLQQAMTRSASQAATRSVSITMLKTLPYPQGMSLDTNCAYPAARQCLCTPADAARARRVRRQSGAQHAQMAPGRAAEADSPVQRRDVELCEVEPSGRVESKSVSSDLELEINRSNMVDIFDAMYMVADNSIMRYMKDFQRVNRASTSLPQVCRAPLLRLGALSRLHEG